MHSVPIVKRAPPARRRVSNVLKGIWVLLGAVALGYALKFKKVKPGLHCSEQFQDGELDYAGVKTRIADLKTNLEQITEDTKTALKKYTRFEKKRLKLQEVIKRQNAEGQSLGQEEVQLSKEARAAARKAVRACARGSGGGTVSVAGCSCSASKAEMTKYLDYTPRSNCPDDWLFVQKLIFVRNCYALPRRKCFARGPQHPVEPLPRPGSTSDQLALNDANVRWEHHGCKSFRCLNERTLGDCRNCFNISLENLRWRNIGAKNYLTMKEVVKMKKGLRIGLDAGGGTGSFAAKMSEFNVTIMTTAMNVETLWGVEKGLPYMETIALRGLIPLHLPHKARLPFFDNTLDVVHSMNSIKYLPLVEFEELLFEWNRVLRPGGIIWFEMFYAEVHVMPMYVGLIELLDFHKLQWSLTPKFEHSEHKGLTVYLNAVLEKPGRAPTTPAV
eukprot:jgi/Mesen1/2133/ME000152S01217